MPRSLKTRRFTLLEILVIIIIILILLSLLFAGLSSCRKKSQEVACLSNINQFNLATMMFLNNNKTKFPGKVNQDDTGQGRNWLGKKGDAFPWEDFNVTSRPLNVYLGYTTDNIDTPVAKCPFNDNALDAYNRVGSCYAGNSSDRWPSLVNKRLGQVAYPSTTALGMELGSQAFIMNDLNKMYWRLTHVDNTPLYPFSRVDGSTIRYQPAPGEGMATASKTINFNVNKHP